MADKACKLVLSEYDVFGFDLDHTIAKYHIENLFKLSYDSLISFLVSEKGYPEELNNGFDSHTDFLTRGIIFEKESGNFLKLDEDGYILRASHGTTFLTSSEIIKIYGTDRKWDHAAEIVSSVNNSDSYFIFENFFDMSGIVVVAHLIDVIDKMEGKRLEKYNVWPDVVSAFTHVYRYQAYSEETGGFFPKIKKDVSKFVERRNDDVIEWLKSLKNHNKKVFILTSSYVDFAKDICQQSLGNDWMTYFDIICTNARKPGFFNLNRPFLRLDENHEKEPVTELTSNTVYSQGNLNTLMKYLRDITGKDNPKICFFGDSLRSDVFPSKKFANWETVYLLEEMEIEGM